MSCQRVPSISPILDVYAAATSCRGATIYRYPTTPGCLFTQNKLPLHTSIMGSSPPSKVVKLGIIGGLAYLFGIVVSPYILPIDFISSKLLFSEPAQQVEEVNNVDAPTPATPPSAIPETNILFEKTYKSIVQFDNKNDPFDGVDIVVHRNGEPGKSSLLFCCVNSCVQYEVLMY